MNGWVGGWIRLSSEFKVFEFKFNIGIVLHLYYMSWDY